MIFLLTFAYYSGNIRVQANERALTVVLGRVIIMYTKAIQQADAVPTAMHTSKAVHRAKKKLTRQLMRGKTDRLGFFETIHMKRLGRSDGKIGLPRPSENGEWTSTRKDLEVDAYQEKTGKIWGELQLCLNENYSRREILLDRLLQLQAEIIKLQNMADALPQKARKPGEEDLPDDLVRTRREREAGKANAPKHAKLATLRREYEETLGELIELHRSILETDHAARHASDRIKSHTIRRIGVYWNSALRVHPQGVGMPSCPEPLPPARGEAVYKENHQLQNDKIERLLTLQAEREKERKA